MVLEVREVGGGNTAVSQCVVGAVVVVECYGGGDGASGNAGGDVGQTCSLVLNKCQYSLKKIKTYQGLETHLEPLLSSWCCACYPGVVGVGCCCCHCWLDMLRWLTHLTCQGGGGGVLVL